MFVALVLDGVVESSLQQLDFLQVVLLAFPHLRHVAVQPVDIIVELNDLLDVLVLLLVEAGL